MTRKTTILRAAGMAAIEALGAVELAASRGQHRIWHELCWRIARTEGQPVCRACRCTDRSACRVQGLFGDDVCSWIAPDLCSHCAPAPARLTITGNEYAYTGPEEPLPPVTFLGQEPE